MEGEHTVTLCNDLVPICTLYFDGRVEHDGATYPWPVDTYVHAVADILTFISRMPIPRAL